MQDLKEFVEVKEKLNGFYLSKMDQFHFTKETKDLFFKEVDKVFKEKMSGETDMCTVYERCIRSLFAEVIVERNKYVRKMEKKALKNRGRIIWDSRKGTFKR